MKTKWTKADAKRAEKMGWRIQLRSEFKDDLGTRIVIKGDRFKSDDEAIEAVMDEFECGSGLIHSTCRKALFLCTKG